MGTAQQEIPVTKVAIAIQYQEDHPGNPGWWRFSRPVLRHVHQNQLPSIREETRWWYVRGSAEVREAQREWDKQHR